MKLRSKPQKPVRKTKVRDQLYGDDLFNPHFEGPYIGICTLTKLEENIQKLRDQYPEYAEIEIERYYDGEIEFYGLGPEPLSKYEARLANYEKRLEKYNEWYSQHENSIKKEIKKREEEANAKATKDRLKIEEREKKELARLKKKYEK